MWKTDATNPFLWMPPVRPSVDVVRATIDPSSNVRVRQLRTAGSFEQISGADGRRPVSSVYSITMTPRGTIEPADSTSKSTPHPLLVLVAAPAGALSLALSGSTCVSTAAARPAALVGSRSLCDDLEEPLLRPARRHEQQRDSSRGVAGSARGQEGWLADSSRRHGQLPPIVVGFPS